MRFFQFKSFSLSLIKTHIYSFINWFATNIHVDVASEIISVLFPRHQLIANRFWGGKNWQIILG